MSTGDFPTVGPASLRRRLRVFGPVLALALASLCLLTARAQVVWLGGGNGNWNEPLKWIGGVIPASNATVAIDNNNLLTSVVTLNVPATLSGLTLSAGDSLTLANGHTLTLAGTTGSVANHGTLALASSGSFTNVVINSGTFTFSGGGTVTLGNHTSNRLYGGATTAHLINSSGHTIQGAGQIGVGSLQISNAGLIVANQANPLTLDPGSGGLANTGTLRAISGATLVLQSGNFHNTGGLIEAQENSHIDLIGAHLTGGTISSVGAGHFHAQSSSSLNALTISTGTSIEVPNGHTLTLSGALQNQGAIKLLSSGSFTNVIVSATGATLTGGGSIALGPHPNNQLYGASTATTLVNQDNTISGAGRLGAGQLQLDNRGTIDANVANTALTIDTSGTGALNSGTLRASSGGILTLSSTTLDNTGGTIHTVAASRVRVDHSTVAHGAVSIGSSGTLELDGATVAADTLSVATGGFIKASGSTSDLGGNVTTSPGSEIQLLNGATLRLQASGTFANSGNLALASSGSLTDLVMTGGNVTLTGGGTVTLGNHPNNRIYGASSSADRLVNANNTIQGAGQIGVGLMGLTNQGTIVANQPANSLVLDPSSLGVENTGTLRATSGATLRVTNGDYTNTGGTIEAHAGSTVQFESAHITGGTLASAGTGRLVNVSGSSFTGVALSTGTTFDVNNGSAATLGGAVANHGTIRINSTGSFTDVLVAASGLSLAGGGTIEFGNHANNRLYHPSGTALFTNHDNTLRGAGQLGVGLLQIDNRAVIEANLASSTLTLDPNANGLANSGTLQAISGGILRLASGTFDNATGTIRADAGSTVQLDHAVVTGGTFDVAAGASLTLDSSTLTGGAITGAPTGLIGIVSGSNTLGGIVTINSGTQLNIGNGANLRLLASGTYAHHGNLSLSSTGSLTDLIVSGGDVTLNGSGTITLGNHPNNRIYGAATTDRLVLGLGQTVRGAGQIGVGLMGFNNAGIIEATQPSNALVLDPSATGVVNTGTLRATSGATLRVIGGTYQNAGGTIEAQDNSRVQFETATVSGGTLASSGAGRLVIASGSNFANIALAGGSILDVNNGAHGTFTGTFANSGTVNLSSSGSLTDFIAGAGGATLQGGGTILLGNHPNNRIYGINSSTTLINQNSTIRGAGQLGANQLQLDNRATVEASVAGSTLTLATSGTGTVNTGTLQAVNGGILRLEGSTVNNANGTVRAAANSRVELSSSTVTGGTLTTEPTGIIRATNGANTLGGSLNLASGAEVALDNGVSLTLLASGLYQNSGNISLNSTGSFTDLKVSGGDTTVSGAGTITLGNHPNNRIYGGGGTDRLVNAGGTIAGSGQIGVGLMGVLNQGTIKANQSAALILDPSAAGVANTGILLAENGATLRLQSGNFTNTGGTIKALGASSAVEFSNATIIDGTLLSDPTSLLRNTGGSTFNHVTLASGSRLQFPNGAGGNFVGTLFNSGAVLLESTGSFTDFIVSGGDLALEGGGGVTLGNHPNNRIYAATPTQRLVNENNTIQGSGQLGTGLMGLTNRGTIRANQSTALVVDPSAAGVTNENLMVAQNGATLALQHGAFNNTLGVIEAAGAGSQVTFNNVDLTGGVLKSDAGAFLRHIGNSSFTDVFFGTNAVFQVLNGTSATLGGTITNGGTMQLLSTGSFTDVIAASGGLTLVGGIFELGNHPNNRVYGATSTTTLVNESALIRGVGQLGIGLLQLDNRAVIEANILGGTLTIDPSASGAKNSGLMTATNGGILRIKGGAYDNAGGTILSGAGSRVELEAATISGGFIGGNVVRTIGASTLSGLGILSGTTFEVANATSLTLANAISNHGTVRVMSSGSNTDLLIGTAGATLTGHGVIELTSHPNNRLYGASNAATLTNVDNTIRGSGQLGLGQLTLNNTGTIEANQATPLTVNVTGATFTNQGALRATAGATLALADALTNSGQITVAASSTVSVQSTYTQTATGNLTLQGGTFSATSSSLQSGNLIGHGTMGGIVSNAAVIAPGTGLATPGIGTLTFTHTLSLTPTSLLRFDLGGISDFDRVQAPSIGLDGALAVSFTNDFQNTITPADSFALLSTTNATGLSGTFTGLLDGARLFTTDGSFRVNYFANSVVLSDFQAIPEPSTYALLALGAWVIFVVRRRRS